MTTDDLTRRLRALRRDMRVTSATSPPIYVQSSFTPTLVGLTIAGTFTYTANQTIVEQTRIGNRLFYNGRIRITAIAVAPTGAVTIQGWTYPGVTDANMAIAGVGSCEWQGIVLPANYWTVALQHTNSAVVSLIRSGTNNALANVLGGEIALIGGVFDLRFSGCYRVAA